MDIDKADGDHSRVPYDDDEESSDDDIEDDYHLKFLKIMREKINKEKKDELNKSEELIDRHGIIGLKEDGEDAIDNILGVEEVGVGPYHQHLKNQLQQSDLEPTATTCHSFINFVNLVNSGSNVGVAPQARLPPKDEEDSENEHKISNDEKTGKDGNSSKHGSSSNANQSNDQSLTSLKIKINKDGNKGMVIKEDRIKGKDNKDKGKKREKKKEKKEREDRKKKKEKEKKGNNKVKIKSKL